MVDVSAKLAASLDGVQTSVKGVDKRVEDYITAQDAKYRAVKHLDLPLNLQGTASGSAIQLGATAAQRVGPAPGYAWSIKRLVVQGLARGATPDVVQFFINDFSTAIKWELNGNSYGVTFGKAQFRLRDGDNLLLQNFGTFNSTSLILVSGELDEVPAEMFAKLML